MENIILNITEYSNEFIIVLTSILFASLFFLFFMDKMSFNRSIESYLSTLCKTISVMTLSVIAIVSFGTNCNFISLTLPSGGEVSLDYISRNVNIKIPQTEEKKNIKDLDGNPIINKFKVSYIIECKSKDQDVKLSECWKNIKAKSEVELLSMGQIQNINNITVNQ